MMSRQLKKPNYHLGLFFFFFFSLRLLLFVVLFGGVLIEVSEAKKRAVSIPDDLDDVVDDEEDEAWREWGRKKTTRDDLESPPDFSNMDPAQIQAEIMKRQPVGPAYGFVKLRLGVSRTKEEIPTIAMRWTKVLRTGATEVKFMPVDLSTVMFTMERGQDLDEGRWMMRFAKRIIFSRSSDNLGASSMRKRDRKGKGCNLRKSLAWNQAFFTEEGVLGPMELSILSRCSSKSKPSGNLMSVSEMSPLTVYNKSTVRPPLHDIPTNLQSKDSKPRKLFPSINDELEAHGVTSGKTPSGKGIFRNIPRSPATHSQKRVANTSTTNPTPKVPKFMPSKPHAPFPTTSRDVASATKSSKSYQSAAKVNVGQNASVRLPNAKVDLACASSSSNRFAANHGKNMVENRTSPLKAIPNCLPSTNKLNETISCAPNKVAPSLPQSLNHVPGGPPAPVHARPSALRMPSPSLGFFCQGKVSPSYNSQHQTQSSESKTHSLRKPMNLRQNVQTWPQTTAVGQQSTKGTVAAKFNAASVISSNSQACLAASCLKPPTHDTCLHMEMDTVMNQGDIVDRRASVNSGGSYGKKDSQEQSGSVRLVVGQDIHEQPGVLHLGKPDSDRVKELEYSDSSSKISDEFFVQGIIQFPKIKVPDNGCNDCPPANGSSINFPCPNESQVSSKGKMQECDSKEVHGDSGIPNLIRYSHDDVARDGTNPTAAENIQSAGNSDFASDYPIPAENKSAGDSDFPSDLESGFIARSNSFDASIEVNMFLSKETSSVCFKNSLESDHSLSLNSGECSQVTTSGIVRMTSGQNNNLSEKYEPAHLEEREFQDCRSHCDTTNAISLRKQDSLMPRNIMGADAPSREVLLNAVPFSDEWVAALETFGEDILEKKTGPVQHSPPDKAAPEPGPWSPVKKKAQDIGPYDCTKYTKNTATPDAH